MGYLIFVVLIICEFGSFMRTTWTTNAAMDKNMESLIDVNFDITMYDLPCKHLKVAVWDKFNSEKMVSKDEYQYTQLDHTGGERGQWYTTEEIAALEQVDTQTDVTQDQQTNLNSDWSSSSDNFRHTDFNGAVTFHEFTLVNFFAEWCSHCRKFSPQWVEVAEKMSEKMEFTDGTGRQVTVKMLKMNCVDFAEGCQKAQVKAFPSIRLYKRDGTFEQFTQKRSIDNIVTFLTSSIRNSHLIVTSHHAMFSEGCRVKGKLSVPRVPGHLILQAEAFGDAAVNPALTNVSHRVNHFSFGSPELENSISDLDSAVSSSVGWEYLNGRRKREKHSAPLDGADFYVERFHEAPQHYLKVVSVDIHGIKQYQMTHADRIRRLKKEHASGTAPQARFTYDFSPMSISITRKSKRWYEFLISLFAILGGTYTIVELTSGAVDSVQHVVKDAIGKNN